VVLSEQLAARFPATPVPGNPHIPERRLLAPPLNCSRLMEKAPAKLDKEIRRWTG